MNEAGRLHEEFFTAASDELQNWGGRTRTSNFPVNSRAVCQLTYTPMCPATTLPP